MTFEVHEATKEVSMHKKSPDWALGTPTVRGQDMETRKGDWGGLTKRKPVEGSF